MTATLEGVASGNDSSELCLWLMQDPGLLPEPMLRHLVAGTSLTGKLAMMTAAQVQLAWEDSMASSTALTTALAAVVSVSSVATSPNTAGDNIQADTPHAVAYAAAYAYAVQAAPVAEVSIISKLLSCCHTDKVLHHTEKVLHHTDKVLHYTDKVLHGSWWGDRPCLHACWAFAMCIYQCAAVIQTAISATCC